MEVARPCSVALFFLHPNFIVTFHFCDRTSHAHSPRAQYMRTVIYAHCSPQLSRRAPKHLLPDAAAGIKTPKKGTTVA